MKTCQVQKFKPKPWLACNPKYDRDCKVHCGCGKGETYDINIDRCVKKCRRK